MQKRCTWTARGVCRFANNRDLKKNSIFAAIKGIKNTINTAENIIEKIALSFEVFKYLKNTGNNITGNNFVTTPKPKNTADDLTLHLIKK